MHRKNLGFVQKCYWKKAVKKWEQFIGRFTDNSQFYTNIDP